MSFSGRLIRFGVVRFFYTLYSNTQLEPSSTGTLCSTTSHALRRDDDAIKQLEAHGRRPRTEHVCTRSDVPARNPKPGTIDSSTLPLSRAPHPPVSPSSSQVDHRSDGLLYLVFSPKQKRSPAPAPGYIYKFFRFLHACLKSAWCLLTASPTRHPDRDGARCVFRLQARQARVALAVHRSLRPTLQNVHYLRARSLGSLCGVPLSSRLDEHSVT